MQKKVKSGLVKSLVMKVELYDLFYRNVVDQLKEDLVGGRDQVQFLRQSGLTPYKKLSSGNQRPPASRKALFYRMASMIRHMVQNPCGVKTLCRAYGVKARGTSVRPSRVIPAGGAFIRRAVRLLQEKGYLARHIKGHYTTEKGKKLLVSVRKQVESQ